MDQKSPTEQTTASLAHQLKHRPLVDMANTWDIPLSVLTEAFPNDLLLKYVIVPTAVNTWWAIAVITGFLFFHFYKCIDFSPSKGDIVCSKGTQWLFAVEFGLYGLMCYTWFLKGSLTRRRVGERKREEELEKESSALE